MSQYLSFIHVTLYVFLWRKKHNTDMLCNLDWWDEDALTLTVVPRQKVE